MLEVSLESGLNRLLSLLHLLCPCISIYTFLTSLFSPCSYMYGYRVPEGELTVDRVAELVGRNRQVNTIDVSTQVHTAYYMLNSRVIS